MFEIIYILILAVVIDSVFGEPKNRFHPVAWLGKVIEMLFENDFILKNKNKLFKKIYGAAFTLILMIACSFIIFEFLNLILGYQVIIFMLVSAVILKFTFSIRGMGEHANAVLKELQSGDIGGARASVSMLVSRDAEKLNEKQIVSATIESISENMVDGVMSPVFYFTVAYLLVNSIPAAVSVAVGFRIISTLDSMIGYRDKGFADLGWFSARLDDAFNYIPARLSPVFFLNLDSIKIAARDHRKTQSPNSGFPMAAAAGYLGVSLEKPGFYRIGDEKEKLKPEHIKTALGIMDRSIMIFILFNTSLILLSI